MKATSIPALNCPLSTKSAAHQMSATRARPKISPLRRGVLLEPFAFGVEFRGDERQRVAERGALERVIDACECLPRRHALALMHVDGGHIARARRIERHQSRCRHERALQRRPLRVMAEKEVDDRRSDKRHGQHAYRPIFM